MTIAKLRELSAEAHRDGDMPRHYLDRIDQAIAGMEAESALPGLMLYPKVELGDCDSYWNHGFAEGWNEYRAAAVKIIGAKP